MNRNFIYRALQLSALAAVCLVMAMACDKDNEPVSQVAAEHVDSTETAPLMGEVWEGGPAYRNSGLIRLNINWEAGYLCSQVIDIPLNIIIFWDTCYSFTFKDGIMSYPYLPEPYGLHVDFLDDSTMTITYPFGAGVIPFLFYKFNRII